MEESAVCKTETLKNASLVAMLTLLFGALGLYLIWLCSSTHVVLMCALALFSGGVLLGFLFGIPRVDQTGKKNASGNAPPDGDRTLQESNLEQNTNLEQISDWLTKIIVGVGLVELRTIYEYFQRATVFIAGGIGLNGPQQAQPLAAATVVYFITLGFLSGYILTRIFLAGAFKYADAQLASRSDLQLLKKTEVASLGKFNAGDGHAELAKPVEKAATNLAKYSLNQLGGKPEDYAAWAKAQLIKKNYEDAIKGYALAVSQFPDDIGLLLEFAETLEAAGRPIEDVRTKLLTAYKKINARTEPYQVLSVYNALSYVSLYLDPPKGFSDAIKYGEEYVTRASGSVAGSIWVNLASAYGQKFAYYSNFPPEERKKSEVDLEDVRMKALNAMKKALDTDKNWLDTFRMLMLKDYVSSSGKPKNAEENDLECFATDKEFRELLGLEPI
ncbi:hypothetical protein GMPD_33820 [Geomonas paludis]|nr:hypothetical protein GMPD_33820 [Geomonas paludis]